MTSFHRVELFILANLLIHKNVIWVHSAAPKEIIHLNFLQFAYLVFSGNHAKTGAVVPVDMNGSGIVKICISTDSRVADDAADSHWEGYS